MSYFFLIFICINQLTLHAWMNVNNLPENYTVAAGYKLLNGSNQGVYWSRQVWAKLNIPKHAFIWWFVMWNRLRTKDRLLKHMNISDGLCLFCQDKIESTEHLFFECSVLNLCLVEIKSWLHNGWRSS